MNLEELSVLNVFAISFMILYLITLNLKYSKNPNCKDTSSCVRTFTLIMFLLAVSLNSAGYIQALNNKETAINQYNSYKNYNCTYEFITNQFCGNKNCQIFTFKLTYSPNNITKEFIVECQTYTTCKQFPKTSTTWTCYTPETYDSLKYKKPELEYYNPRKMLNWLIMSCVFLGVFIIIEIAFNCCKKQIPRNTNIASAPEGEHIPCYNEINDTQEGEP